MKVKELVRILKELDDEAEVVHAADGYSSAAHRVNSIETGWFHDDEPGMPGYFRKDDQVTEDVKGESVPAIWI